jgi:lipopolysaccharide transport system permease protein
MSTATAFTELTIEPNPGHHLGRSLLELWAHRSIVVAFADRNVRVKYKQAALGIAWAVIQPVAFVVVFTLTVGRLVGNTVGGGSYAAFALSTLVAWTFLQTAVTFGANALLSDASLIRKVYFPREASILGAILASAIDFGIGLGLFAVAGPFLGARISLTWLLAPLLGVILLLLATGIGCLFGALNVYYRDFRYALPFGLQLWLFASPVAYPLTVVPAQWRLAYVLINPAAGVLDSFRRVLTLGQLPDPTLLLISLLQSLVIAWFGYRVFKGLEPNFADVV